MSGNQRHAGGTTSAMYNMVKRERDSARELIARVVEQIETSSDLDAWEERQIFAGLLTEMRQVALSHSAGLKP